MKLGHTLCALGLALTTAASAGSAMLAPLTAHADHMIVRHDNGLHEGRYRGDRDMRFNRDRDMRFNRDRDWRLHHGGGPVYVHHPYVRPYNRTDRDWRLHHDRDWR